MLGALAGTIRAVGRFLRRFGVCGNAGLIVGLIAGMALVLLDFIEGGSLSPSPEDLLWMAILLTLFGWIVLLVIFTMFVRARLATIVVPTFVNSLLVSFLTVYVTDRLGAYPYALPIGALMGLLIGYVLCGLYRRLLG